MQAFCVSERNDVMRDPKVTHKIMAAIPSKNTRPEVILRKALWNEGIRYRKNYTCLPGKPDIAITKYKIAIFLTLQNI